MAGRSTFPIEHLSFENNDSELSDEEHVAKYLTLVAASAVSLLSYEPYDALDEKLRTDDRFKHVRALDLLSGVWPVANVASALGSSQQNFPHPIVAWSTLLQTVFLGFRGTHSVADWLTDLNVAQKADPSLASRFHAGFYGRGYMYTTLIEQLLQRFKVVVCGHSLGGAAATIASYIVLTESPKPNAWELDDNGLSVVTFGLPASVVAERDTTGALQNNLMHNFHHIINPDDVIPLIVGESTEWISKFLNRMRENTSLASTTAAGFSSVQIPSELVSCLLQVLTLTMNSRGNFAHFGHIYLLKTNGSDISCRQVTAASQIPVTPGVSGFPRFHAMEHYASCIRRAVPQPSLPLELGLQDVKEYWEFEDICWPLPEAVRTSSGVISDGSITVTIEMEAQLAQFFTKGVFFELDGKYIEIDEVRLAHRSNDNIQVRHLDSGCHSMRFTLGAASAHPAPQITVSLGEPAALSSPSPGCRGLA